MLEKPKITWTEVEMFIKHLEAINSEVKFTGVYGIPRGGLVLAVMISNKLDIPMLAAPTKDCLIVDDISDTGRSLYHYTINETQKNKYFIATLCYKRGSLVVPNYYLFEKGNEWVVFPWEKEA